MVLPVNNYKRIFLARLAPRIIAEVKHLRNIRPPYTLKYMESLLDEGGYLNMIMDCWIRPLSMKKAINETLEFKPEVVVISIVTSDTGEAIDYASDIKGINHRIIVIAVGQEPTAIPEKYIYEGSPVDFVLKGESEISLIQLLRELNNGRHFEKVRGLYSLNYRDNTIALIDDLNMLPYPRYSDRDFRKYIFFYPLRIKKKVIWGHILSSRGCPYECIFCSQVIRESYGKTIRLRTPQNIVNEIQGLISIGANIISFDDDNFTTLIEHVTGICDEIIRRNLKINWICHARIDNLTEDLLVLMNHAGCVLLR